MATCALSGVLPEEPVVSVKTGHVFEKRLILRHIEATHQCPITREPLSVDDLITIKTTSPFVRPRPPTAASFPALLQMLQAEWDASVLEAFNLKRNADLLRQELAHALYQVDAANRVIARLIKERDDAQAALGQVDATVRQAVSAVSAASASAAPAARTDDASAAAVSLPATVAAAVTARAGELTASRRAQVKAATAATAANLAALASLPAAPARAVAAHATTVPGVTALAQLSGAVAATGATPLLATGGADGAVALFDSAAGALVAVAEKVHAYPVAALAAWADAADGPLVAVSGASDGSAALVTAPVLSSAAASGLAVTPLVGHAGAVAAVDVHPTGRLVATGGADKTWRLWDASTGAAAGVFSHADMGAVSALCFHPDGLMVVAGDATGRLLLVELLSRAVACVMHDHTAAVTAVACSPNGYIMASGDAVGRVCVWDLRSQTCVQRLEPAAGVPVRGVRFDGASGTALVVATGSGFVVYKAKDWSVVKSALPVDAESAELASACIAAAFGPKLGSVVTAGAGKDRTLRVFTPSA